MLETKATSVKQSKRDLSIMGLISRNNLRMIQTDLLVETLVKANMKAKYKARTNNKIRLTDLNTICTYKMYSKQFKTISKMTWGYPMWKTYRKW